MKVICPKCKNELVLTAEAIENEMLVFAIKYEGEFLQAKTVGGLITNTDKLLKAIARESGNKVMVAFGGFESKEKELDIKFLVTNLSNKKGQRKINRSNDKD